MYANEEALFHFQRGLVADGVALESSTPAPDLIAADLLFGLGRAQIGLFRSSQMKEAVVTLTRAFDHCVRSGNVEKAVEIAPGSFLF